MRIAVLAKQVPRSEELAMGADGRIRRADADPELNPYCRRAVAKGVELASTTGGECVVFTLGPPSARDVLLEAIAWGATRGVHLCDEAFAGSDTLATAVALAAAIRAEGRFDMVLAGRNSVDGETAQVGPELAELLGLPLLSCVRHLRVAGGTVEAICERDDGHSVSVTRLPAVITTAERLCDPAKMPPERRVAVSPELVATRVSAELGDGPWGAAGSPTSVGAVRAHEIDRARVTLSGSLSDQVVAAATRLRAVRNDGARTTAEPHPGVPARANGRATTGRRAIAALLENDRPAVARELLGEAARLAHEVDAEVVALAPDTLAPRQLVAWGADRCVQLSGSAVEQDVADTVGAWCAVRPWAMLCAATTSGVEVAARVAAGCGLGLTGDAVALTVDNGRLTAWKPAFGGQVLAAVTSASAVQLCTVRPGMLPLPAPRAPEECPTEVLVVPAVSPTAHAEMVRDDDVQTLARADVVLAVGAGVAPEQYPVVDALRAVLGGELAATRKVTDQGWQPRARQLGITGRSVAPRLVVSLGSSGKFNHMVGVRQAGFVLAVNRDPAAPVFDHADLGIVGDVETVVPLLTAALVAAPAAST